MKLSIILVYGFIALTVMTVRIYSQLLAVINSIIAHLTHNSD